jgi:hypothetical protein
MARKELMMGMLVMLLVFGLVFSGCATTKVDFVENIPADQQAIFFVEGGSWDVVEFSGVPVRWFSVSAFGSTTVTIPSGRHTIKFNFYWDLNNHFMGKELTADFEPGHKYRFIMRSANGRTLYFGIYDETLKKIITPMPI